jgi:excisionase family DNA binding protein
MADQLIVSILEIVVHGINQSRYWLFPLLLVVSGYGLLLQIMAFFKEHKKGGVMELNKDIYRPDEVARLLDVSRRTIYRMIHSGRISAFKPGNGHVYRIHKTEIEKIMEDENEESML